MASSLNEALAIGDWKFYTTMPERMQGMIRRKKTNKNNENSFSTYILAVTAEDVRRVARTYLEADKSTVGYAPFFAYSSHPPLTFLSPSSLRYFIPKEESADKKDAKSKTSEETKEAATEQTDKVYTFLFPFHLSPLLSSRSLLLFSLEYSFIYQEGEIERIMEGLSVEQSVSSEGLAARIIDTSPLEGLRYKLINIQVGKEDKREREREREEKQEKKNE